MAHELPAAAVRARRARAVHRREDDGDPPRQAPRGVRHEPERRARAAPDFQKHELEELLRNIANVPEAIRTAVRNNGGGHANHAMFWQIMAPKAGGEPTGPLADAINASSAASTVQGAVQEGGASAGSAAAGPGWSTARASSRSRARRTRTARSWTASRPGPRRRRVGARLLPEVPEPPGRLRRRLVERGQLARGREAVLTVALRARRQ